jgi:hypothetical protein
LTLQNISLESEHLYEWHIFSSVPLVYANNMKEPFENIKMGFGKDPV